MTQTH